MTDDVATGPEGVQHRSLTDDIRTLTEAGRELAQAELAYQKARATYAGKTAWSIAIAIAAVMALAVVALMALVLGLILSLAPILTPIGATAAVVAGLLIAALLCFLLARFRWHRMKTVIHEAGDTDA